MQRVHIKEHVIGTEGRLWFLDFKKVEFIETNDTREYNFNFK